MNKTKISIDAYAYYENPLAILHALKMEIDKLLEDATTGVIGAVFIHGDSEEVKKELNELD